jgi:molecular chaperone DnaK (HSP70)
MAEVLGIDLGTGNSSVFCKSGSGSPVKIKTKEGTTIQGKVLPSYVEFNQAGEVLYVGRRAYEDYRSGNDNPIIWGSKRLIGISYEVAKKEFRRLDYRIEKGEDGGVIIPVGNKNYSPVDVAALILQKIKEDALNKELNAIPRIDKVVVSHPAYFDGARRDATLRAARNAFHELNPEVIDLIPEPTAAAIGYGLKLPENQPSTVCVIDLGAGTLDVVRAELKLDSSGRVSMMANSALGNAAFGGIDIDDILVDWAIREYKMDDLEKARQQNTISGQTEARALYELRQLRANIENLKIKLSELRKQPRQSEDVQYNGEYISIELTRETLEKELDKPLSDSKVQDFAGYILDSEGLAKIRKALKEFHPGEDRQTPSYLDLFKLIIINSLTQGEYTRDDIEHILLVGGPMRMPCIRKAIREVFACNAKVTQELLKIETEGFPVDPMDCVALGATLYGAVGQGRDYYGQVPPLDHHYAVIKAEVPSADGQTCVYCYPSSYMYPGLSLPAKKSATAGMIRIDVTVPVVPIVVLEGEADTLVPGSNKIHWRKSVPFQFHPIFDEHGDCGYTVTLEANEKKITTCIIKDKNSTKEYSFIVMSENELPADSNVVFKDSPPVTYETVLALQYLGLQSCKKAEVWLNGRHGSQQEVNRPSIKEHAGNLVALLPRLGFAQNQNPHTELIDEEELGLFYFTLQEFQEATKLVHFTEVSGSQIIQAREESQALFQEVQVLSTKKGMSANQLQDIINKRDGLKDKLSKLPNLTGDKTTDNPQIVAEFVDVLDTKEELKHALDLSGKGPARK